MPKLTAPVLQPLDAALANRFNVLFPDGLEWDTAGVHRLLMAGFGPSLNLIKKGWPEPLPSLKGLYLAEISFYGAIIPSTELTGANLSEASLEDANLSRSELSGTNLHEANLTWTNLRGAHLNGADLSEAVMGNAMLELATLDDAVLDKAQMIRIIGCGTSFVNTKLRNVDLTWSILLGCDMSGADLTGSNLRGCNLHGVNFDGATLTGVNFADTVMTDACLDNVKGMPENWKEVAWET